MLEDLFSIQIFFIIFRETLESAIIVSVLLAFIHQRFAQTVPTGPNGQASANDSPANKQMKKSMILQVWLGAILGLVVCFIIGVIFVCTFYFLGRDYWSYTERVWEGVFSLLSSLIITIMGVGLLRINKVMKVKWWKKLGDAYSDEHAPATPTGAQSEAATQALNTELDSGSTSLLIGEGSEDIVPIRKHKYGKKRTKFTKRYFLAILPFVTTLREGLEAVVFIGGIGMSSPPSTIPLSILAGIGFGAVIGYLLYKGGNHLSLQYFLIFLTCFLYMVSAGLTSRGVWFLELEQFVRACGGLDVSETGSGPGSYDISKSVWHVNCCNGLTDGWWMVFNAIFGWTNSATYGSVGSYCAYWLLVILWLEVRLHEEKEGVLPFIPVRWQLKRIKKRVYLYEARLAKSAGRRLDYLGITLGDEERETLLSGN